MSQVLHDRTGTTPAGAGAPDPGRGRRPIVAAIVGLGMLLGAAAGWTAVATFAPDDLPADLRSLTAQQARLDAAAEYHERLAEARRWDAEQKRWEAMADHFAPGWRER
jgi:hypothetical protein